MCKVKILSYKNTSKWHIRPIYSSYYLFPTQLLRGGEGWIRRLVEEEKFGASNYPIGKYNTSRFICARLESCLTRLHLRSTFE